MLFWWLTAFVSLRPLANLLAWALLLALTSDVSNRGREQQRQGGAAPTAPPSPPPPPVASHWAPEGGGEGEEKQDDDDWWRDLEQDFLDIDDDHFTEGKEQEVEEEGPDISSPSPMITGIYKLENTTDFDAYLKEVGVSGVLRGLSSLAVPLLIISKRCPEAEDDDDFKSSCLWTFRTDSLLYSHESVFRLGEWFRDVRLDGRAMRVRVTADEDVPNRLVEVEEIAAEGLTIRHVMDFVREGIWSTHEVNGVRSTEFFSRQFVE